jgi:lipoprotein-anchoring transpeptidase ErfK/SrfK
LPQALSLLLLNQRRASVHFRSFIPFKTGTSMSRQHTSLGPLTSAFNIKIKRSAAAAFAACSFAIWVPHAALAREFVTLAETYPAGTVVIKRSERRLYFFTGNGTAIRYPVAIGRAGMAWQGKAYVQGKFISPSWTPPAVVRRDHPGFPALIPGGSPRNPMGAAAITLSLPEVAIHGTTASMRRSVGTAASYGCIRMYNEDVVDLFHRVAIGTPVVSIP